MSLLFFVLRETVPIESVFPISWHGLSSPQDGVPDEVFMIIAMNPALLEGLAGVAVCRDQFNEAM